MTDKTLATPWQPSTGIPVISLSRCSSDSAELYTLSDEFSAAHRPWIMFNYIRNHPVDLECKHCKQALSCGVFMCVCVDILQVYCGELKFRCWHEC